MISLQKIIVLGLLCSMVAACSPQYRAEKAFYRATRYAEDIFKDSQNIPDFKFKEALNKFERIIKKYPQSRQAKDAILFVGNLHFSKGDYNQALKAYERVPVLYPDNIALRVEAAVREAQCYEKKQEWDNAYKKYRHIVETFPYTLKGLQVPLYLLKHSLEQKNEQEIKQTYTRAVVDYKKVIAESPDSQAVYAAYIFLSEVHMRAGYWSDMVKVLETMYSIYPQSRDVPVWVMTMAAAYDIKLKNKAKARQYYQIIVDQYPDSPWIKEAQKRLAEMITKTKPNNP